MTRRKSIRLRLESLELRAMAYRLEVEHGVPLSKRALLDFLRGIEELARNIHADFVQEEG